LTKNEADDNCEQFAIRQNLLFDERCENDCRPAGVKAESRCGGVYGVFISLTTHHRLTSLGTVSFRFFKKRSTRSRLIATLVLFFVFFLPLHLHFFNSTARVGNECSCYHGTQIQAGLTLALAEHTPFVQIFSITTYEDQLLGALSIKSPAVRAPPSSLPL
jgi:hypothetical protein